MGRHGTSARAAHNHWARVQSSGCHDYSAFSTAETWLSADQYRGFCSFLFVPRFFEHASFTGFQHFLLTGTSLKSCLGATSDLNEFFKKCQNSLMTGCRYTTPRAAGLSSVTGKHRRTSSTYRVASSVVDISSGKEKSSFAICFRRGAD